MPEPLFIYGAGGLGREILAMVRHIPEWEVAGFYDDALSENSLVNDVPVVGNFEKLVSRNAPLNLILAIGDPKIKAGLTRKLSEVTFITYPILIHPSAILLDAQRITIGEGSIITAGCILTTDIRIGNHVLLNLNTTVGHDTQIGDCTSVMPGVNLAGSVSLGKAVLIGSGASVINKVGIGDRATIGAGAVVIRDVPEGVTAVGVPAAIVKKR